jgi:hypothetical protein
MILEDSTILALIHCCDQRRAAMRDALAEDESVLSDLLGVACHLANNPGAINRLSRKTRLLVAQEIGNYAALAIAESIRDFRQQRAADASEETPA